MTYGHPNKSGGHSPVDIAFVLATDEPLFLVGGQAVNLWGLYYRDWVSEMAPMVSQDVDVLGGRETLSKIAELAGNSPQFFSMRPPTNEVGVVMARKMDGGQFAIEVLNHVHGISNEELCQPAYTITVQGSQVKVRVPSPVALLQAKIANVSDLPQSDRQDKLHILILAAILPAYFADIQSSVIAERINERDMLNLLERLLNIVADPKGKSVLETIGIRPHSIFYKLNIDAGALPRIDGFFTKRLPRILPGS